MTQESDKEKTLTERYRAELVEKYGEDEADQKLAQLPLDAYRAQIRKTQEKWERAGIVPDVADHDPKPWYLRFLIEKAGLTQREAARRIGITDRMMRYYVAEGDKNRECPYVVQFCLEALAKTTASSGQ